MTFEQIIRGREPVERYLRPAPGDLAPLQAARETATLIWKEHEASAERRRDDARIFLEQALVRDPSNAYLLYLRTAQRIQLY